MSINGLTVGIISYNRPKQLLRCIESLIPIPDGVNVVICDDASPKSNEIEQTIKGLLNSQPKIKFIKNSTNLGYDRNLYNVIEQADQSYVLLLGDDDMLEQGCLENVLSFIRVNDVHVGYVRVNEGYVSTYDSSNIENFFRYLAKSNFYANKTLQEDSSFIYNSILFSGLLFKRNSVLEIGDIVSSFFKSIYIQVALFSIISSRHGCYYIAGPGVKLGSDGENGFGLNGASKGLDSDLSDRKSVVSNINYHKRLIKVVQELDGITNLKVSEAFFREYKLRSVKAFLRARRLSRVAMLEYWKAQNTLNIPGLTLFYPIYTVILILPNFLLQPLMGFVENTLVWKRRMFSKKST